MHKGMNSGNSGRFWKCSREFTGMGLCFRGTTGSPAFGESLTEVMEDLAPDSLVSSNYHPFERRDVGLQKNQDPHQRRKGQTVKEYIAQDAAFMPIPVRRGARHDDA